MLASVREWRGARWLAKALLACVATCLVLVLVLGLRRGAAQAQPGASASVPTPALSGSVAPPALAASVAEAAARARAPSGSARPPGQPAERVDVGIYLQHLTQIDIRAQTFLADFYVWFRWKGEIDPTRAFELRNDVEQWQIVKVPIYVNEAGESEPVTFDDGTKYQVFRIEARMGHPFNVQRYPLDEHDLTIQIEDAKSPLSDLVYVVDKASSGIEGRMTIPGWRITYKGIEADETNYGTTFGDPRAQQGEKYTRATLSVHVSRPKRGMIVKTVVPLIIVILMTFGVFLVDPHAIDARLTLSVTALVSAVALQFTTITELPEVGYLVMLDTVYVLSYAIILLTTAASIFAARVADSGAMPRALRMDRIVGITLLVAFLGGVGTILLEW